MKFKCLESCGGKCCNANWDKSAGFVFLTQKDRNRLSSFLGQTLSEFALLGEFAFTRFTSRRTRQWFLKDSRPACRFLKDGKCSVYQARPTQCRTFPFWPELIDPNMVKLEKLKEFCPGIGEGDEVTHSGLSEQLRADFELCQGN